MQIFIFLWWWFVIVLVSTVVNLFFWISVTVSERARYMFIMKYLRVTDSVTHDERHIVESFVHVCNVSTNITLKVHSSGFPPTRRRLRHSHAQVACR